jgi:hypothetical protein
MKVDVEGHELGVLSGVRNTISRSPEIRIVMEWSLGQMVEAGTSAEDIINFIRDLGLLAAIVPSSGKLEDIQKLELEELRDIPYENIILWRG